MAAGESWTLFVAPWLQEAIWIAAWVLAGMIVLAIYEWLEETGTSE